MNRKRRQRIKACLRKAQEIEKEIEEILNEENAAWENLPSSIQCSDRGYNMEDAIAALEEAKVAVGELEADLTSATQY